MTLVGCAASDDSKGGDFEVEDSKVEKQINQNEATIELLVETFGEIPGGAAVKDEVLRSRRVGFDF